MKDNSHLVWHRILLKLSGEALAGGDKFGINRDILDVTALEISSIKAINVELAIVIGGGNFFRGVNSTRLGIDRCNADYIGMLATVMNALALKQALKRTGVSSRVLSALTISTVVEPYVRARALKHLRTGKVVIFAAGIGNPFFTTDTAASLRALEMGTDIMVKATKFGGVYNVDPAINPDAIKFDKLKYQDIISKGLKVMDMTAISLCAEHKIPIQVIDLYQPGSLQEMVLGKPVGTLISDFPNIHI